MYALNASTGAKLWSNGGGQTSPAVVNGIVYVGDADTINELNASTGALLWSYTTGSSVGFAPTVANGVIYVGSADHNVYALNASTGALDGEIVNLAISLRPEPSSWKPSRVAGS